MKLSSKILLKNFILNMLDNFLIFNFNIINLEKNNFKNSKF
jgi:hypothetical protein